jgi:hypothetical protein
MGCGGPILIRIFTGFDSVATYDTQRDAEDVFLPGSSRVPIQSPLTTHKAMLRTYFYPDPQGSLSLWNELHRTIQNSKINLSKKFITKHTPKKEQPHLNHGKRKPMFYPHLSSHEGTCRKIIVIYIASNFLTTLSVGEEFDMKMPTISLYNMECGRLTNIQIVTFEEMIRYWREMSICRWMKVNNSFKKIMQFLNTLKLPNDSHNQRILSQYMYI